MIDRFGLSISNNNTQISVPYRRGSRHFCRAIIPNVSILYRFKISGVVHIYSFPDMAERIRKICLWSSKYASSTLLLEYALLCSRNGRLNTCSLFCISIILNSLEHTVCRFRSFNRFRSKDFGCLCDSVLNFFFYQFICSIPDIY